MEDKIDWKITFWHLLKTCGKWLAVYGNLRQYMAIHGNFSIVSNWKAIGKELVSDWKGIGRPAMDDRLAYGQQHSTEFDAQLGKRP